MSETALSAKAEEQGITQQEIDQSIFDLYDEYCHGDIDRRTFLSRAATLAVAGGSGLIMAQALMPRYAQAQTVRADDARIKTTYVTYLSPDGNSGTMSAYLARPVEEKQYPVVLVVHENRGLNPYIADVARRLALEGFMALAPDGLHPLGGYPGNDDDGRTLQASLDQVKLRTDFLNSARFIKAHTLSTKKLGAVGFCYGGGVVNYLAAALGDELQAGVPYYGVAADTASVRSIKAPLLCHLAEHDERINATYPAFETALKAADVNYRVHTYPGTQHGFHNDSTPRYNDEAAKLSWERTVAHFRTHLA